jgi:hypothetical protein
MTILLIIDGEGSYDCPTIHDAALTVWETAPRRAYRAINAGRDVTGQVAMALASIDAAEIEADLDAELACRVAYLGWYDRNWIHLS